MESDIKEKSVEDKSIIQEETLIKERKEKFINFLKKDNVFTALIAITLIALILSINRLGIEEFINHLFSLIKSIFTFKIFNISIIPEVWLFIISLIALILAYYKKRKLIPYLYLIWVVLTSIAIRTTNLNKLKDITTNTWTLGPDLDPFLFLRWAEYIVEHGKLFVIDTMRYSPLFFNTKSELILTPYLIAWFHKIASFFGSESVTYSAILYPVIMFALTIIAFFLFTRKIFLEFIGEKAATITALIASFFLTIFPVFMPRTIAGIPEKESAAFFFMFLSFYLFLSAWKSKSLKYQIPLAILAGISTACMALIWGGVTYVFLAMAVSMFITFMLGSINKNKFYIYLIWMLVTFVLMHMFSARYAIKSIIANYTVFVAFIIFIDFLIFNTKIKKLTEINNISKIPPKVISLIISIVLIFIITIFVFDFSFFFSQISQLITSLVNPIGSRLTLTVAENKQPFFVEWVGSFGPNINGFPLFFWLFFLSSIYMFYKFTEFLSKKERIRLTFSYIILIFAITFTRYSPDSLFNGTSTTSLLAYAAGFIIIISTISFYYYKYYKLNLFDKFKNIELGIIILFSLFILGLLSARGAIRLIMTLVPPASIIASYLIVSLFIDLKKIQGEISKPISRFVFVVVLIALIFSGYQFYNQISNESSSYAPSVYNQQWQKAMAWVRDNTLEDAVFGHWWDYGYWVQSIGRRATVLDGGNAISYWNHLMGRHALTSSNERDALEFLYAHNTTHFLIDSTDIGKYTAFSTIGSDINYDRRSWFSTFIRDSNQIQETKNSTIYIYTGGTSLDEDIKYENNETKIFLPSNKAGLGAVLIEQDKEGKLTSQPQGIFVYREQQYRLPFRYAYVNKKFYDFKFGIESGIFLMPRVDQNGDNVNVVDNGALIYLSNRTVKSQLARLYLYKEDNPYFKLVHSEDDFFVSQLKTQSPQLSDIIFFNGVRGPIRIWEIKYPKDIQFKEEYISTIYPEELQLVQ